MIKYILFVFLISLHMPLRALDSNLIARPQCRPEGFQDEKLFQSDFGWKYLVSDIPLILEKVYSWNKRLPLRAYFDSNSKKFKFPYDLERGGDIEIPESFLANVRLHIENALEKKYVDAVMFPDMGHSHFYIPQAAWDSTYNEATASIDKYSRFYEKLFLDREVKTLYHTAEQIITLDEDKQPLRDRATIWRFATRNLFAWNDSSGRLDILQNITSPGGANTVGEIEGFRSWSAGYNLSANKDGCFLFKLHGKDYYYDLSMYDLAPPPQVIKEIRAGNQ